MSTTFPIQRISFLRSLRLCPMSKIGGTLIVRKIPQTRMIFLGPNPIGHLLWRPSRRITIPSTTMTTRTQTGPFCVKRRTKRCWSTLINFIPCSHFRACFYVNYLFLFQVRIKKKWRKKRGRIFIYLMMSSKVKHLKMRLMKLQKKTPHFLLERNFSIRKEMNHDWSSQKRKFGDI